ncbi:MAG: BON domain-containing protein [Nitrospirae bacterium]|nr:BON domain-containing protein [Candidatus Manganitrophaceae bacterium]
MKRLILIVLLIPLMVAGCSTTHKQKEKTAAKQTDKAVEAQIRTKLKSDPLTAAWEINPKVDATAVTLTGLVDKEEQRRRAEELSRDIVGELRRVNNQISLTEEVILDKSIIAKLNTALVTNSVTRLATIDVQSQKGVVRLHGTVATDEQKREAERLAAATAGVKSVENNLKVATPLSSAK